ncbi:MAG: energy transducer TonB [Methylococcales bacterium]
MSALKWNSIVTTITRNEKPAAMLGWLALLVTLLHIKSALWLSHPLLTTKVETPKPLEVTLLPVPVVKANVEPVKPEPVEAPKKKSPPPKAKPKPAPVPKPKPIVQNPPVVKPVAPKIVEPEPAVIQTPSKSAPQPTDYIQKANPEKAASHTSTNSNLTNKSVTEAKSATHGNDSGGGVSSGVVALERVQPKYPSRALNRHIEGKVTLEFTISPSGSVIDPKVKQAEPEDIFDDAALDAIRKWKFKQKIVNGISVEQRATQTLHFKLSQH